MSRRPLKDAETTQVFAERLARSVSESGRESPWILPAEAVSLLTADVPVRGTRAKRAALAFALEDRIGAPLDEVHVALCRPSGQGEGVLAAIVDRAWMAASERPADAPVLPETFALPSPVATGDAQVWAVWCAAGRALVRVSDGTGFCVAATLLPLVWRQAGQPACDSYGEGLPPDVVAQRRGDTPPPPDSADLAVDLRQGAFAPAATGWVPRLIRLAAVVALGLMVHLAIALADAVALARIAEQDRAIAQAAVAQILPGIDVGADVTPILRRLAPPPPAPPGSAFLPLLARVSETLLAADLPAGFRRMTFASDPVRLSLLVEMPGLEDLQRAERVLRDGGLDVTTGAASATAGIAEAEFVITGAPR